LIFHPLLSVDFNFFKNSIPCQHCFSRSRND
jgi:hypothetical protein